MNTSEELLSFLDLLDLDEELVDTRLHSIMARSNHNKKHLTNALQLLLYKHLINTKENEQCNNVEEIDFVAKLIQDINEDSVENVCKITKIVLKLNPDTLHCSSEHFVLQIVHMIELLCDQFKSLDTSEKEKSNTLMYLKVCDSVLDAVIEKGEKLSMVFLHVPLEKLLSSSDEQTKVHFLTSTVPKLFHGIEKYEILTEIWGYLKDVQNDGKSEALKVLSSLSDYYLPAVSCNHSANYESTVVLYYNFWDILLYGLLSADPSMRKISVYLAKRAIDYVTHLSKPLNIESNDHTIFTWDHRKSNLYKNQWDNFFILMDSLEEKQSNIVLPSLQLFDKLSVVGHCWLISAYNIGLRHDNNQVRLKCAEHRIKSNLNSDSEAIVLLQALDDINFYEDSNECHNFKAKLLGFLNKEDNVTHILKAIPQAHISPVPLCHISEILAELDLTKNINIDVNLTNIIITILKASCNIITMRKAIHNNIAQFIGKSCKNLHWRDVAQIISSLQLEIKTLEDTNNPILKLISDIELDDPEKKDFYNYATESYSHIDIGFVYFKKHPEELNTFIDIVKAKVQSIQNVTMRQYSSKAECFKDVIYVLTLLNKCDEKDIQIAEAIKVIAGDINTVLQYIFCLLSSDSCLNIEEIKSLFGNNIWRNDRFKDTLIAIYKTSVILLRDPRTDLDKIVLCIFIINSLGHNLFLLTNYKHEMLDLKSLMQLEELFEKREIKSLGRTRNIFYEKHCESVYTKLEDDDFKIDSHLQDIVNYVEKVMDCGGYGCLKWILKIVGNILKILTDSAKIKFNITEFINRAWREIEELKSNNQYSLCMKEFVNMITEETLVQNPKYNNIVSLYCNKIIEYGPVKNSPLYYLTYKLYDYVVLRKMNGKSLNEYGQLIFILSEILLYCPVPRKDQRIADNLALEILKNSKYGLVKTDVDLNFNFEIQLLAVTILSTVDDDESLQVITSLITSKIDNVFKSKLRYHGNSQMHRTFQTGLQHLLFISLLKSNVDTKRLSDWCMELLGRLPHQLSVRICLEWFTALYFYKEKVNLNGDLLQVMQSKNLSLPSQLAITYWLVKRKIADGSMSIEHYEFVMDTLLSHTMGQMFNIRLLAQFLATKLYKDYKKVIKYQYIIDVIDRTLEDNAKDKNFVKLKEDYFFNEFDLLANLTPYFIYYLLPRLCDVNINEAVDQKYVLQKMKEINKNVTNSSFNEWAINRKQDEEFVNIELNRQLDKKIKEDFELLGTIQKKYIPWKSMSDINVYNVEKKKESPSDLIVVASLIDKLPNLGGMARTSEVFGVKTYVIDSLRHLQDKQFQGLSVSAERWIDVEEVRPGQPLKEFLNRKKAEGYSVVAAEQTSTSSKLQTFKFPRKTLLLLGHEKEGIPCDLLPMMDHCVEIPQQGFVRSLNVHVTAAIFVWEYARQNLL